MDTAAQPTDLSADLVTTLDQLRAAWRARTPDYAQRREDLKRLKAAFQRRMGEMQAAIAADFGHRSEHESLIADGMTVVQDIDHTLRHLRSWMRPKRIGVGWQLWPARAQLRRMPLGVVGVMSPWNYPVNLALAPLVAAIAGGNHVFVKPSEHTPRTSEFLRSLLAEVFPADRVAVALGGPDVAAAFSALPFDHLLFTGSTVVGRKVMAAAAPNLTPVTLELGGKSPAVVAADYPLDRAAARLATGKWFNCGQTCIAPDYVLVDAARRDALVDALRAEVQARYGATLDGSRDYTRVVNEGQYRRLRGYLDQARAAGCTVIELATADPATAEAERLLPPTVVLEPSDDLALMQEEIFGPILPVRGYTRLEDAVDTIARRDRPLALYAFSNDSDTVERVMASTLAGGITVNDTLLHFAVQGLPFGGVGPSGMGQYHGRYGFDTFTKPLPVVWQRRWNASDLLKPPYRGRIDKLVRAMSGAKG